MKGLISQNFKNTLEEIEFQPLRDVDYGVELGIYLSLVTESAEFVNL